MQLNEQQIRTLLEQFMAGATSVDDEKRIADWFRTCEQVPSDLADYQALFRYFDDGMPLTAPEPTNRRLSAPRRWLIALAAAAAIAIGIVMALPSATDTPTVASLPALPAAKDSTKAKFTQPTDTMQTRQVAPRTRQAPQKRAHRYSLPLPKVYLAEAKADSMAAEATLLADEHVARMQIEQEELLLTMEINNLLHACAIADMADNTYTDDEYDTQEY